MPLSLILAAILLITCSGCIWGWDRGRGGYGDRDSGGYDDRDSGGHDGDRHDDRRDSEHHR
jgi:hypothetical protein